MQQIKRNTKFNVFCYGTLEFNIVMKKVTGATFPAEPATLIDYARYLVKGAPYPAVIQQHGAVTEGTLYHGLTAQHLQRMDEYEDTLYDRIESEVLTRKGELIAVQIYIVPPLRAHHVGRELWNKKEFEELYLHGFCKTL